MCIYRLRKAVETVTLLTSAAYNNTTTQSIFISSGLKKPTTCQAPAAGRRECVGLGELTCLTIPQAVRRRLLTRFDPRSPCGIWGRQSGIAADLSQRNSVLPLPPSRLSCIIKTSASDPLQRGTPRDSSAPCCCNWRTTRLIVHWYFPWDRI